MDNLWCCVVDEDGEIIIQETIFSSWAKNGVKGPPTHGLVRIPLGGDAYKLQIYPLNRIFFVCEESGTIYKDRA